MITQSEMDTLAARINDAIAAGDENADDVIGRMMTAANLCHDDDTPEGIWVEVGIHPRAEVRGEWLTDETWTITVVGEYTPA